MAGKREASDWIVGTESALRKVFREKGCFDPGERADGRVSLSAARNEYESFQLILCPSDDGDLKTVHVEVSDLVHEGTGSVIHKEEIEVFRVGYVETEKLGYPVEHVGWWPDPLLPMEPFDVNKDEVQPVWVTVRVPPGVRAGTYRGKIEVRPSNAAPKEIEVALKVRDFALPDRSHLEMVFGFGTLDGMSAFHRYYPPEQFDTQEIVKKHLDLLARYGVNSLFYGYVTCRDDHLLRIDKSGEKWKYDFSGVEKVLEFLVRKGFTFNIFAPSFWPDPALNFVLTPLLREFEYLGEELFTSAEFERRVRELLESYVEYLRERGWLDHAYCYIWDEPRARKDFDHCERTSEWVKEVSPSLRTALACGHATPRDLGGIDIWCPHLGEYERDEALYRARKEVGEEVWWYVSNSPNYPYPTLFVDFPAVAHRIIFWMSWKYGLDGFAYWNVSAWNYAGTENFHPDPEKRWPNVPWKTQFLAKTPGNGGGQLIYPGPDGPIPSIRLAIVRDGMEDYEYLWLLKDRIEKLKAKASKEGKGLEDLIEESEEVLGGVDTLVRSTSDYEEDPDRIYAVREKVADQIEKVNRATLGIGD